MTLFTVVIGYVINSSSILCLVYLLIALFRVQIGYNVNWSSFLSLVMFSLSAKTGFNVNGSSFFHLVCLVIVSGFYIKCLLVCIIITSL